MGIDRFRLLKHIGQFDSVSAGTQLPLAKLTLMYAENGRGKTTLAAILRSAGTNEPQHVIERQRLGSAQPPHIVLGVASGPIVHENGTWSATLPHVAVFDDAFVAANVCSGIEIETTHRQNAAGASPHNWIGSRVSGLLHGLRASDCLCRPFLDDPARRKLKEWAF